MKSAFLLIALCAVGAASISGAATNSVPTFQIQRLEFFSGVSEGAGLLINNRGQVAALVTPEDGSPHLVLRSQTKTADILLPPGIYDQNTLRDLNGRGFMVGLNHADYSAFYYRRGDLLNLSNLVHCRYFFSVALNSRGRIVGGAQISDTGTGFAFSYHHGHTKDLGHLVEGGHSFAAAVNNRGQIVGAAQYNTNRPGLFDYYHAVIFSRGKVNDLGTLDGDSLSVATGINEHGHIIGFSGSGAFIYRQGTMRRLTPLTDGSETHANGINNKDQIVGSSMDEDGHSRAVIYIKDVPYGLNELIPPDSDVILQEAFSINERSEIVARSNSGDTYLLTPAKKHGH